MSKHNNGKCLSLDLRGELPAEKFERAISAFFTLIREVTNQALAAKQKIRWTVTVRSGSAIVNAIPHYTQDTEGQAMEILRAVPSGVRSLESGSEEMPKLFTRDAAKAVRTLGRLRGLTVTDLTGVRIRSDTEKSFVTTKSVAAVDTLIAGQRQDYGAIEGKMQTITERGGFRFVVYDSLHDHRIDCFIEEELMEEAVRNFSKRVRVSGLVQYDREGDPVSIKVTDIYAFRPNNELPSVKEMRGIFKQA
jgi:hypothetical protein